MLAPWSLISRLTFVFYVSLSPLMPLYSSAWLKIRMLITSGCICISVCVFVTVFTLSVKMRLGWRRHAAIIKGVALLDKFHTSEIAGVQYNSAWQIPTTLYFSCQKLFRVYGKWWWADWVWHWSTYSFRSKGLLIFPLLSSCPVTLQLFKKKFSSPSTYS